jgi:hypothetical protein
LYINMNDNDVTIQYHLRRSIYANVKPCVTTSKRSKYYLTSQTKFSILGQNYVSFNIYIYI